MTIPAVQPPQETQPLLTVGEACQRILDQVQPLPAEPLPLLRTAGRFSAETLLATQALPGFDNSSMDGYVLHLAGAADGLPAGSQLVVTGEQPAGPARGLRIGPGEAIRVFTGAPIPEGGDAVVMQEDVERLGNGIVLREAVQPGEFIRRAGGDLARGQKLFGAGEKLTPQRLGLLASQGIARIAVAREPRAAILATGDELQTPGQPLSPGEIYESNSVMLAALAGSFGAEATVLERARDERVDLDKKIGAGLHGYEVLVIAGGVSVGERDFVKERLAAAGVRIDLWRVFMQPGKPFLYGRGPATGSAGGGTHVFGLPGNPVSAFVTFLLFVRPAILKLAGAGATETLLPTVPATAAANLVNRGNRPHYLRGSLDGEGRFSTSGRQESHALHALSRSSVLVRLEPGASLAAGSPLEALVWA